MASMDWGTQSASAPATYQEFLVPAMFAPFAERLVEHGCVRPGSRVLDVACGTGVVSRAAAILAGTGGSVAGVDLGEPTLAIARSHPAEENAAPIDYAQADAAALPFDADDFDVALCQQGLQFFPERAAALAEMRRVLKPGGRVAVATWKDIRAAVQRDRRRARAARQYRGCTDDALTVRTRRRRHPGPTDVRRGLPRGCGHRRNDRVHVGIAP